MTKNSYNPGNVNTNSVLDNAKGVNSSINSNGTVHTSVYDKESNRRVSWDEENDGSITNVHSTNQKNNRHRDYKGGK